VFTKTTITTAKLHQKQQKNCKQQQKKYQKPQQKQLQLKKLVNKISAVDKVCSFLPSIK
jgi:hypothetical protein